MEERTVNAGRPGTVRRRVAVTTSGGGASLPAILGAVRTAGGTVDTSEYESALDEGRLTVTLDVRAPSELSSETLLRAIEGQAGVVHIRITPPS